MCHFYKLIKLSGPIARMGRLVLDNTTKGQGLGKLLMVDALKRVQTASELIGVFALLVDAKDNSAKNFYLKYGFTPLIDEPMAVFLPLTKIPKK
ncbi:MAG: GNAT family N-acetyltransferase [Pseudobdellovibrionaceae bacterium]